MRKMIRYTYVGMLGLALLPAAATLWGQPLVTATRPATRPARLQQALRAARLQESCRSPSPCAPPTW